MVAISDLSSLSLDEAAQECEKLWLASYDAGVDRHFQAQHKTIKETMLALLASHGDDVLIRYGKKTITRAEADAQACKLANALIDHGLQKGDRVSIIVSNRPETVYAFMACYKAGFVAAAYNQRSTSREILATMRSICTSALLIEADQADKVLPEALSGAVPTLRLAVVLDDDGVEEQACGEGFSLLIKGYDPIIADASPNEPSVEVKPDDRAILLFTGGTTGIPKGCVATHEKMVQELSSMHHWCAGALSSDYPSFLICMPMTHIMGINYGINWQLINGGSVCVGLGGRSAAIMESFHLYHPDAWGTLPTLLHSLSLVPDLEKSPYHDLELVVFGGSFIAREMLEDLSAKTKGAFVESYGMSESFGFTTCNPVSTGGKVGSIGLPMSNTDLVVVDVETGLCPKNPGERGEIVMRGPQILSGYWNNPEETKIALRDGWLYTGDIGYMDEDGFFYVVDRKKDTIVVSGFNVFPKEIDELLLSRDEIIDACTIGVPDAHSGERPKSFVVLRAGETLNAEALNAWMHDYLVAYKVPKYFEQVDEIPKTKARKPDREALRRSEKGCEAAQK